MKKYCQFCPKKYDDEDLTDWGTIPKHVIRRGTDAFVCNGSNRDPR